MEFNSCKAIYRKAIGMKELHDYEGALGILDNYLKNNKEQVEEIKKLKGQIL